MHLFQQAKAQLHMQDVAERYTAQRAQKGKMLCPFHDDKHPSMQLKNERFCCFACGAHGDAIDFTAQLFAEPSAKAVARLAADFALNLPSQTPTTPAQRQQQQRERQQAAAKKAKAQALSDAFAQWDADTYDALSTMHRTLRQWRHAHAPRAPAKPLHPRFCFALWHTDWLRHLLDIFIDTNGARVALYQNMTIREEIYELARRFDYLADPRTAAAIAAIQQPDAL